MEQQSLKRTLSPWNVVIFGMIMMSPLAPFQVFGSVAQASFGMVALVYLIGATLMFFTALSYARFNREFPLAGSVYNYVGKGINQKVGYLAGWLMLSDYLLVPALMCLFSSLWLTGLFPNIDIKVIAIVFIVITGLINIRGIALNARVNTILFVVQLTALAVFIAFMIKFVFIDGLGMGGFSLEPFFQAERIDMSFIATAVSIILLGFIGFDGISTLAEEVKDPERVMGKATVTALLSTALLFMTQSYLASLTYTDYAGLDPDMALFDIAKTVGGEWFYITMIIINVLAVGLAVTLNAQSAVSRVLFSMARDKSLPFSTALNKLHSKYKTPTNAIIFSMAISVVLILFVDMNSILMLISFGALTSFMVLNLAVIIYFFFKKKERGVKGFFFHLLFPLIGFLVCASVWFGFDKVTMLAGLSWLVVGVLVAIGVRSAKKGTQEVTETEK